MTSFGSCHDSTSVMAYIIPVTPRGDRLGADGCRWHEEMAGDLLEKITHPVDERSRFGFLGTEGGGARPGSAVVRDGSGRPRRMAGSHEERRCQPKASLPRGRPPTLVCMVSDAESLSQDAAGVLIEMRPDPGPGLTTSLPRSSVTVAGAIPAPVISRYPPALPARGAVGRTRGGGCVFSRDGAWQVSSSICQARRDPSATGCLAGPGRRGAG